MGIQTEKSPLLKTGYSAVGVLFQLLVTQSNTIQESQFECEGGPAFFFFIILSSLHWHAHLIQMNERAMFFHTEVMSVWCGRSAFGTVVLLFGNSVHSQSAAIANST